MSSTIRHYSWIDQVLIQMDTALTSLFSETQAARSNPAAEALNTPLTTTERQHSISLMRVNHTGEICAQALYQGQLCSVRSEVTRKMLRQARDEELDHLAWTAERIKELGGNTSYLNVYWYLNSFFIGFVAGLCGDAWSLGFVEETEKQVSQHLSDHLGRLPKNDSKSQKILEQMQADETEHGQSAKILGAADLPFVIQLIMRYQAKVMTTLSHWI